ncbi:hypothetical protein RIF29_19444 [Crotalaria pallida]|uniref:Uncharacterized protein n=1 Tax=Crotalaria pallida TaxID=3830 RepID=A0AAN9EZI9_CROPI
MNTLKIAKTCRKLHREKERYEICEEKAKKLKGTLLPQEFFKSKEMEVVHKKMMEKYNVENKKVQTKIEDGIQDGGEASGNGGVVVGDTKAEKFMDFLLTDIAEKGDQFPSWNEFRFQA